MTTTAKEDLALARLMQHTEAVRTHWISVVYCKTALADEDKWSFLEAWQELPRKAQIALWMAPKYGGIWTTAERNKMREYWAQ